jgi:uncharacterized protein YmfQ (DUF2313 family)
MTDVKETLFEPISKEDNFFLLASHIPSGKLTEGAFYKDTNLGKLIAGLALEYWKIQILNKKYSIQTDINQTIDLIEEWEKSVGLPNDCFPKGSDSLDFRRKLTEQVFSNFGGVQTTEDFQRVADFFGYSVIVKKTDFARFPLIFPIIFVGTEEEISHTIWVEIISGPDEEEPFFGGDDFKFPLPFGLLKKSFLQCLFDLLAPANVLVYIVYKET